MRGLNANFWHQTVTTEQIETYITKQAGIDLSKVFDQYLRTTKIPVLQYKTEGKTVSFKYENVVNGFMMPVRVNINSKEVVITPNETLQILTFPDDVKTFEVNRNYYINAEPFK